MPELTTISREEWADAARAGRAPSDVQLRKAFTTEVKAADDASRMIEFIISTDSVDRQGDTIAVDGWQLGAFKKNPVVLWAHSRRDLPIARAVDVRVRDGALRSKAEFATHDLNPLADQVYRLLGAGYLNATSVGFVPLEYDWNEERFGFDFTKHELVEYSVVPIPANADALMLGRSLGDEDRAAIRAWAEHTLEWTSDEPGLWLPRSQVERVIQRLDSEQTVHPVTIAAQEYAPAASVEERATPAEPGEQVENELPPAVELNAEAVAVRIHADDLTRFESLVARIEAAGMTRATIDAPSTDPAPAAASAKAEPAAPSATLDPEAVAQLVRDAIAAQVARLTGRID